MFKEPLSVPIKILRFLIFAFGLAVCGIVLGIVGILIGGRLLAGGDSSGFAALGMAIGGLIIGYPAGIITGIILLKKVFKQKGSLWLGIAGAAVGAAAVLGLAEPLNINANTTLLFVVFFTVPPFFSLGGFYLKR